MSPLQGFNVKGGYVYYKYFTPMGFGRVFNVGKLATNSRMKNNFWDTRFSSPTSQVSRLAFNVERLTFGYSSFVIGHLSFGIWNLLFGIFFSHPVRPRTCHPELVSGSKMNTRFELDAEINSA